MEYYLRIGNKAFGPFPEQEIANLVAKNRINRSSYISTDGTNWRRAGEFSEFFSEEEKTEDDGLNPFVNGGTRSSAGPFTNTEPEIWYISRDGRQGLGPYTTQTIAAMLRNKQLSPDAFVWRQGEKARSFRQVPFFQTFIPVNEPTLSIRQVSQNNILKRKISKSYMTFIVGFVAYIALLFIALVMGILAAALESQGMGVTALIFMILSGPCSILYVIGLFFLLYYLWSAVQPYAPRTTPGKAVGFLFIPFFNLYWQFISYYNLSIDLNRVLKEKGRTIRTSEGLALSSCILNIVFPLVGTILMLIVLTSQKRAALALLER